MSRRLCLLLVLAPLSVSADDGPSRDAVEDAMWRAARYYRDRLAVHGGYVYHYALDSGRRWGEGLATEEQIWVQPPGTPTVGLAFLSAWEATGERAYIGAATDAAEALAHGQLESGGWTNCIDFDPRGSRSAAYRNGKGRGKNNSSFDDGQTQSALLLLIRVDGALKFENATVHEAATVGLDAVLAAQYPNGGFPQVWTGPVPKRPVLKARYPDHDWRTEGRIKEYWNEYTLNDNVPGYITETLIAAHEVYGDEKYLTAVRRLGDFLIAAQMPDPQPGWAQQYNAEMEPIWARKFEPAAIAGDETQEAIETLLRIHEVTGDEKYLAPIPAALAYLRKSLLPDGRIPRFLELQTNRPLYMERSGKVYSLTYDDSNLPDHYGWKIDGKVDRLAERFERARRGGKWGPRKVGPDEVRRILAELDGEGRWVTVAKGGDRLVGQPKFAEGERYVSSQLFSDHMTKLATYVSSQR